jgi:hypothetical protein
MNSLETNGQHTYCSNSEDRHYVRVPHRSCTQPPRLFLLPRRVRVECRNERPDGRHGARGTGGILKLE